MATLPAKAILAGIGILLTISLSSSDPISISPDIEVSQMVKEMGASYALVNHFASFKNFLSRLSIYAEIPPTPALANVLVNIIIELISTLTLATKQLKQRRLSKFALVVTTVN